MRRTAKALGVPNLADDEASKTLRRELADCLPDDLTIRLQECIVPERLREVERVVRIPAGRPITSERAKDMADIQPPGNSSCSYF